MRQIRNRHQQRRPALLDLFELGLELLDSLSPRLVGREECRGVLPLALGARDLVACGVLLALESFELRNQAATLGVDGRDLLEFSIRLQAAIAQPCTTSSM